MKSNIFISIVIIVWCASSGCMSNQRKPVALPPDDLQREVADKVNRILQAENAEQQRDALLKFRDDFNSISKKYSRPTYKFIPFKKSGALLLPGEKPSDCKYLLIEDGGEPAVFLPFIVDLKGEFIYRRFKLE